MVTECAYTILLIYISAKSVDEPTGYLVYKGKEAIFDRDLSLLTKAKYSDEKVSWFFFKVFSKLLFFVLYLHDF